MAKTVTLDEAQRKLQRAIRLLDNIGDPRADEFRAMSPQEYAQRKGLRIENPSRRAEYNEGRLKRMSKLTRAELERRVRKLEAENEDLAEENELLGDKLEAIGELIEAEEVEEGDDGEDDLEDGESLARPPRGGPRGGGLGPVDRVILVEDRALPGTLLVQREQARRGVGHLELDGRG